MNKVAFKGVLADLSPPASTAHPSPEPVDSGGHAVAPSPQATPALSPPASPSDSAHTPIPDPAPHASPQANPQATPATHPPTSANTGAEGHRERLKQRFLTAGSAALADYELLELLLFSGIPRRDTKPLAKALLAKFGSFAAVLSADLAALKQMAGMTPSAAVSLKVVAAASTHFLASQLRGQEVFTNWQKLLDYCYSKIAYLEVEELHLLFLDSKNQLITDEVHQRGTVDQAAAYPREILKRALVLGASALIIVHNHPSGDPEPSAQDIRLTNELALSARLLNIRLHDHLVVGKKGILSFKALGLLQE
ncbi:MAG: DNA repair protein RadC [Alphaproteobacteria bacterium]|nr:DNA repair protein RadC [Alphaproteobacteria bacterium]